LKGTELGSLTVNSGFTLTLTAGSSGNYFRNDGAVTNNGTITIGTGITPNIYNTLTNNGTLNNASQISLGTGNWGSYGALVNNAGKTISNTGQINVGSNCTFTNNGTFTNNILNVTGTLANSVAITTGSIQINSGGTYRHMFTTTAGTIPTCTWMTGSTCEIAGYTSSAQLALGLSQSFYHFKWNCPNNSDMTWDLPATFTVLGNLSLTETGPYDSQTGRNKRLNMGYSNSTTVNVGGNMVVEGGTWWGNLSSGLYTNFNVTGNFTQTGGVFFYGTSSNNVFHVAGKTSVSGGTFDLAHSVAGTTMKLDSNLTVSSGGTLTSTAAGNLWFQNSGTQTYMSGGTVSGPLDFFVKSGAILAFYTATDTLSNSNAGSDFTVESGGGMVITHAGGISTTASTGCIRVGGTKIFNTAGNYTYSSTVAQSTGNALPATVNNFTKSGASTTTLTNNVTISGSATWTNGTLNIAGKTLTMNGAMNGTMGWASCDASSTIVVGGSGAMSILPEITGGTSSITINRAAGVTMSGPITVVNLTLQSGNLDLGAYNLILNGELTNSGGNLVIQPTSSLTLNGSGTAITIPSNVDSLVNLTVNRTNGVTLGSDLMLSGTLIMTSGSCNIGAHTLTLNGGITTTTGVLTGGSTSNIILGGSSAVTLPSIAELNNLTLNRSGGLTLSDSLIVDGTLTLTAGTLTLGANNLITLKGAISVGSGSLAGGTTTDLLVSGSAAALALPVLSVRNLTLNRSNGITLGGNLTVNGNLTLTSGTLSAGSNWIYLYGGLSATGGTIATTSNSSIGVYGSATPANLVLPSTVDSLNNFTLNRTNGVTLGRDLVVKTLLTRTLGSITPNGHLIGYAPSAGLTYSGGMMMQDAEFPAANGPTNLTIGGTDTLHASRTVSGSLTLTSGTLAIGANTLTANGTVSRTGGSFTGGASSNLVLGGAGGNITSFYMATSSSLNNLTIDRSGATVIVANSLTVTGTLTLTNGTLSVSNSVLALNGTLSLGSGGITTTTASNLSIGGTGAAFTVPSSITALAILTVNRGTGVSLSAPLSINWSGTGLVLTRGVLTTTAANLLSLASGSTASAGSDSGFVSGPMAKIFASTSAFTFPIGKGAYYMPVSVTPSATSSTTFKAEYFNAKQSQGNTLGTGLNNISDLEYFDIARTAGTANAYVTLSWNTASQIGTVADLRVGRWTGTQWENLGNSATTGTATLGTVKTTTYVTSFSQFALGSSTGTNPLPVELVSFTARTTGSAVNLSWHTATETNNYGFEIERTSHPEHVSPDAIITTASASNWTKIGFVEGHGTTNAPQSYSYADNSASGKYSYRLKQIDRDGKFEYSKKVEATVVAAPAIFALSQNYPNPFNPSTVITYSIASASHVTLRVYDMLGREVATLVNEQLTPGNYTATFNASRLSSGVYFYRLDAGTFSGVKRLSVMK
jgi:Secretion system C-terminal sorting domain